MLQTEFRKLNNYTGLGVLVLALIAYFNSVAPTASFWDCGEYIACANELEVPHPPGAPFYLLIGRLFAFFGGPDTSAYLVNLLSVFSGAFTILFVFWTTTILGKRIVAPDPKEPTQDQKVSILTAGLIAAGGCIFASSFWFNVVEAEVYAFSSFFTALVVWLMFKWERRADEPGHMRYILLITFLMGISVGVHLLNLLTIPALVLIFYFRKYKFTGTGLAAAIGIAVVILAVILYGISQYTFVIAWAFERLFVGVVDLGSAEAGGMGLPVGTGAMIWFMLLAAILIAGIAYTHIKRHVTANLALLGVVMVYLGISSYAIIVIRAQDDPPINENDPDNMKAFTSYMKREQYGDRPLLYGPMYHAYAHGRRSDEVRKMYHKFDNPGSFDEWGKQSLVSQLRNNGVTEQDIDRRYVRYDDVMPPNRRYEPEYPSQYKRFFPRMYSQQSRHYRSGNYPYAYVQYLEPDDKGQSRSPYDDSPDGLDNLEFFFDYQIRHMYIRYFFWNFVGRVGDKQDSGWESGLAWWEYEDIPELEWERESRNHYYFLPLLLGLIGAVFHYNRHKKDFTIVALLFFFTGLGIILYLNQTPMQPRERDYSYAGSIQTFAIWIGIGALALCEMLREYLADVRKRTLANVGVLVVALIAVPFNMGYSNWADHSRAGRYVAPDSARNLLQSCAENAILFTNGDNDTFPLWYLQEVEGVRTDVRIINLSLLNTDWYIHELKKPINEADPVPLSKTEFYYMGERHATKNVGNKILTVKLPANPDSLVKNGIISPDEKDEVENPMVWNIQTRGGGNNNYLMKQDLMIYDIIKNVAENGWNRPIYFSITIPSSSYMSLIPRSVNEKNIKDPLKQWYFRQEGMAYRVVPINQKPELPGTRATIERSIMYKNMMEKFWFRNLGPDSDIYLVENIRRMMGNFRNNFVTLASAYMRVADELEQKVKANQVTNRDSARQLVNSYRDSAKAVLDSSAQFISDDVAPIPSYIFAQKGHWYAELSQNDFDTREEALYNLRMGKQRALDEIQYKGGGVSMQDNNVRALNRVMSIYQRTLNMPDKALEIAEILASYAQGRQRRYFQQMIQRLQQQQQRNRQDTARGDTTDTAAAPAGRQAPATPQPQPTPSDLTEPQQ